MLSFNTNIIQANLCPSCGNNVGAKRIKQCVGVTSSDSCKHKEKACEVRVCFTSSKGQTGCVRLQSVSDNFRCQKCCRKMGIPMSIVSDSSPPLKWITIIWGLHFIQVHSYQYNTTQEVQKFYIQPCAILLLTFPPLKMGREMTPTKRSLWSQVQTWFAEIPEHVSWLWMWPCYNGWYFAVFLHRIRISRGCSTRPCLCGVSRVHAGAPV